MKAETHLVDIVEALMFAAGCCGSDKEALQDLLTQAAAVINELRQKVRQLERINEKA